MIYADANILIRLIEGDANTRVPIEVRLASLKGSSPFLTTSMLSRMECRVKPLRQKDQTVLLLYEKLFSSNDTRMIEIHSSVIEKATELRSRFSVKTPDAIHLASAIVEGVSVFLTGDRSLAKVRDINVEVI